MKAVLILVATSMLVIGFGLGKIHTSLDYIHCESFTKNGVTWTGYVSMKDGDIRCFWKEERYPWRLMQGVPVSQSSAVSLTNPPARFSNP